MSVSQSYDTVVIESSDLDSILPDHKEHLNWLRTYVGEEAEKFYLGRLENILGGAKVGTTVQIPMKQIGGIRISLFTYSSTIMPTPSDPITLIFTSNAKAESVIDYLENKIFPPWLDTGVGCASPQWIRLENPVNSGNSKWVKMYSSRAIGGCALIRSHMRLFDVGFDSTSQGMGDCCIGGVHYERWEIEKLNHVIQDWNRSREFLTKLFADLPLSSKTSTLVMQQPSNIQNIPYDGIASMIPL